MTSSTTPAPAPSGQTDPALLRTKRLILCPQDKGGIGKSFVATLLYDYLIDNEVTVRAFDLDHANSTLRRFVEESVFINTDVETGRLAVLDRLIEALDGADVVLADSRSGGHQKLRQYFAESRLIEMQAELDLLVVFVLVAVDDKDAISQIANLLDFYGNRVRWLVARNLRDRDSLDLYMRSNSRKMLADYGAIEIDVPCLADVTRQKLQLVNLTVGRGQSSDDLFLLDRSRCVRFHNQMEAEFGKAGRLLVPRP